MADGSAQDDVWPLPKFYFNIDLGDGKTQGFSEISGLESEVKAIEYRHGSGNWAGPGDGAPEVRRRRSRSGWGRRGRFDVTRSTS